MGRKERRVQKKLEKNPIRELNKIQNRFYSQLFCKFAQIKDPRHPSYITYTNRMMLGTLYYKGIAGIDSMQEMNIWNGWIQRNWKGSSRIWCTT